VTPKPPAGSRKGFLIAGMIPVGIIIVVCFTISVTAGVASSLAGVFCYFCIARPLGNYFYGKPNHDS
jgi:hypothetical protein